MTLCKSIQRCLPDFMVELVTLNNLTKYEPIFYSNDEYYIITDGRSATKQDCVETIEYMDDFPPDMCHCFGFSKGGQAVAFLSLFEGYPESDTMYVGLFLVDKKIQKRAIGSTIMKAIIDEAFRLGYASLKLSVQDNNVSGYPFWKKLGFQMIGETVCDGFVNLSMELKPDILIGATCQKMQSLKAATIF